MDRCVKQFSTFINDNYHISIADNDISDTEKYYIIDLLSGTEAEPLICNDPSHDHTSNQGSMRLEMTIEQGGEAYIVSVVSGCSSHGTANMLPDMRGCGIGTALMLIAECVAIAAGINKITLDDSTSHEEGRDGFYESLGYNRPDDDEAMEKNINVDDLTERINSFKIKVLTLLKYNRCAWFWDLPQSNSIKRTNESNRYELRSKRSR